MKKLIIGVLSLSIIVVVFYLNNQSSGLSVLSEIDFTSQEKGHIKDRNIWEVDKLAKDEIDKMEPLELTCSKNWLGVARKLVAIERGEKIPFSDLLAVMPQKIEKNNYCQNLRTAMYVIEQRSKNFLSYFKSLDELTSFLEKIDSYGLEGIDNELCKFGFIYWHEVEEGFENILASKLSMNLKKCLMTKGEGDEKQLLHQLEERYRELYELRSGKFSSDESVLMSFLHKRINNN